MRISLNEQQANDMTSAYHSLSRLALVMMDHEKLKQEQRERIAMVQPHQSAVPIPQRPLSFEAVTVPGVANTKDPGSFGILNMRGSYVTGGSSYQRGPPPGSGEIQPFQVMVPAGADGNGQQRFVIQRTNSMPSGPNLPGQPMPPDFSPFPPPLQHPLPPVHPSVGHTLTGSNSQAIGPNGSQLAPSDVMPGPRQGPLSAKRSLVNASVLEDQRTPTPPKLKITWNQKEKDKEAEERKNHLTSITPDGPARISLGLPIQDGLNYAENFNPQSSPKIASATKRSNAKTSSFTAINHDVHMGGTGGSATKKTGRTKKSRKSEPITLARSAEDKVKGEDSEGSPTKRQRVEEEKPSGGPHGWVGFSVDEFIE
jgi:hypothetical protein